jgi:glycosyltransferase involved in cell wall biosynthesis
MGYGQGFMGHFVLDSEFNTVARLGVALGPGVRVIERGEHSPFDFSIVLPVFNESESISEVCKSLIEEIKKRPDQSIEVIFIDDGSSDNSVSEIEKFNWKFCRVYGHINNLGHQRALLSGIMLSHGKFIGTMDSDGQHPVQDLFAMFEIANNHQIDLVQGVRTTRRTDGFFKKLSARLFYWFMTALLPGKFMKDAADFRVISSYCRELLLSIDAPLPLRFTLNRLTVRSRVYEFEVKKRFAGESKYSISKMISLAILSVITVSQRPLKNIAGLGIGVSFLSSLLLALIILTQILGKTVSGWASLASLIAFFGALNLLSIGVVALYVSASFENSRSTRSAVILMRDFHAPKI